VRLNDDYLIRMIERVVVAFAKIFLMKDKSSSQEIIDEMNSLSVNKTGLDMDKLENMYTHEMLETLGSNILTYEENCRIAAELLNVRGDIYLRENNTVNSYNCYLKSFEIYLNLSNEGIRDFVMNDIDKIDELDDKLSEYALPIETEIMHFRHKFRSGQFAKVEDILFELLKDNKSDKILEMGYDFYNQLLDKNNDELIKGNFSRNEIQEGIDMLNRIKG
jgi:hypothetical protein